MNSNELKVISFKAVLTPVETARIRGGKTTVVASTAGDPSGAGDGLGVDSGDPDDPDFNIGDPDTLGDGLG